MLFIKLPSSRILSYELPHHSLAAPVTIMVGNGMGTKNGILFKTAVSLEKTGKTQIVALDKTGTITQGEPKITDMIPVNGRSETELWAIAYTLEKKKRTSTGKSAAAMSLSSFSVVTNALNTNYSRNSI